MTGRTTPGVIIRNECSDRMVPRAQSDSHSPPVAESFDDGIGHGLLCRATVDPAFAMHTECFVFASHIQMHRSRSGVTFHSLYCFTL